MSRDRTRAWRSPSSPVAIIAFAALLPMLHAGCASSTDDLPEARDTALDAGSDLLDSDTGDVPDDRFDAAD